VPEENFTQKPMLEILILSMISLKLSSHPVRSSVCCFIHADLKACSLIFADIVSATEVELPEGDQPFDFSNILQNALSGMTALSGLPGFPSFPAPASAASSRSAAIASTAASATATASASTTTSTVSHASAQPFVPPPGAATPANGPVLPFAIPGLPALPQSKWSMMTRIST